jgi:hypothetical protein
MLLFIEISMAYAIALAKLIISLTQIIRCLNPVTFIGTRSIFVAFAIANKRNTTYITPFDYVLVGTPRTETHPVYEDTSVTLLKYYSTITFYVIA